ncbi:MAG: ATP-binding protein [Oligoflexia bacterium]|nr:ATP-binding protein [Oligoflexia bacterium]
MKRIRTKRLDLQAKIVLTLVAVIVPTSLVVTIAENKLTQPVLEAELRQVGITAARTLAAEIVASRWLQAPDATARIESRIQEILYTQPNLQRIDVIVPDATTGTPRNIASNVEEEPGVPLPVFPVHEKIVSELREDDSGLRTWEINVPIEQKGREGKGRKVLGSVHVVLSLKLVGRIMETLWKTTATSAAFSVATLLLVLGFFLRKTLRNERLLRLAESQNLQLTEQLHEAQRQLMNTEKLAVMGQLTASFAHEIGTPLNAVGGHLQLLKEDLGPVPPGGAGERLQIVDDQLQKIEEIVKGFLQSTAKPASQRQLVDLNRLVDKSLGMLGPRIQALGVEARRSLDRKMGPVRVVPLDIEQVLTNLLSNSLDSLRAKQESAARSRLQLEVATGIASEQGRDWAEISVLDTGEGIPKSDLENVLKPFFTTKRPGEGTGLGLTISQQLMQKYDGTLGIDSKEGAWTRVTLRIPYQA